MTTEEALLNAIIDEPDNDDVRLVYSDWLEDQGRTERAELIRIQCRAEALPEGDPQREKLEEQAKGLITAHGSDWHGPLPEYAFSAGSLEYQRGMARFGMTAGKFVSKTFQKLADESFVRAGVQTLWLWNTTKRMGVLANSSLLNRFHSLSILDNSMKDEGFRQLVGSPHLSRLQYLRVRKPHISDAGLHSLAKSRRLPALRTFVIADNGWLHGGISPNGINAVLKSTTLPNLTRLGLARGLWNGLNLRQLLKQDGFQQLESLEVHDNFIGVRDLETYASCEYLCSLRHLDLGDNHAFEAGARVLLDSPHLTKLERLEGLWFEDVEQRTREELQARFHVPDQRFDYAGYCRAVDRAAFPSEADEPE